MDPGVQNIGTSGDAIPASVATIYAGAPFFSYILTPPGGLALQLMLLLSYVYRDGSNESQLRTPASIPISSLISLPKPL